MARVKPQFRTISIGNFFGIFKNFPQIFERSTIYTKRTQESDISKIFVLYWGNFITLPSGPGLPGSIPIFNCLKHSVSNMFKDCVTSLKVWCSCSCSREELEGNCAWSAVNEFYASLMLHIFNVWKTQNKTIKDSG